MAMEYDPTKAYLIHLSGQGDINMKLVNHETFRWVCDGGDAPSHQVKTIWEGNQKYEPNETLEDVAAELRNLTEGSSPDNDRAIMAVGDPFGAEGDTFESYSGGVRELNAFLKAHNLELGDEFEGYIY
jgi:hypothetical protein